MKLIAELHCHTNVSGHAFNTLTEMCRRAAEIGLSALAVTNHGPALLDTPSQLHFYSYRDLPRQMENITLVPGAEVSILNPQGEVDLPEDALSALDFRIASFHLPQNMSVPTRMGTRQTNTEAYLAVLEKDSIDCLGHCAHHAFPFFLEDVIRKAADFGKLIELNTNYLRRCQEDIDNYTAIMKLCKTYRVPVAVTSDAHAIYTLGNTAAGLRLLEELGFPEEQVVNSSRERLDAFFRQRRGRALFQEETHT